MKTPKGEKHQLANWSMGHSGDREGIGILFTREDEETFHLLMDWKQVAQLRKSLRNMVESGSKHGFETGSVEEG